MMDINELEMAKRTIKQHCSSWKELRYDEKHGKPYFIAKRTKTSSPEILCPVISNRAMTFDDIKTCIKDSDSTSVSLAIYECDSSVVLYKVQRGLIPPVPFAENDESVSAYKHNHEKELDSEASCSQKTCNDDEK